MNRRLWAFLVVLAVAPFGASGIGRCWAAGSTDNLTTTLLPTSAFTAEKTSNDSTPAGQLAIAGDSSGPAKQVYFKFNRKIIPKGACVTQWTIRLYKSSAQKDYQYVQAFPVKFNPPFNWENKPALPKNVEPVALTRITSNQQKVDLDHNVKEDGKECEWREENDDLSVVLQSESPVKNIFHGMADSCGLGACNTQPRLIVSYYMKAPPAPDESWLEQAYDPQHSGRTIWKTSQDVKGVSRNKLYEPPCGTGYITEGVAPVMEKGQIILNTQLTEKGGPYDISAIDGRGQVAWHTPVCEPAAHPLAVDQQGRLYVATVNCLLVLDAEGDHKVLKTSCWTGGSPSCSTDEKNLFRLESQVEARSVLAPPTIGKDGVVYLPTNLGVFALTPYPDLRVLWRFVGGPSFGPVALSPDETTAYVVEKENPSRGSTPPGPLIAIDTTDGSKRWSGGSFHPEKLPQPVVGRMNGRELIFAVDQYEVNEGTKKYLEKHLEVFDRAECEKSTPKCLKTPVDKGWVSRPVLAGTGESYGAYFVKGEQASSKGKLCRYLGKDPDKVDCAPSDANDLSPLSLLAADGGGNVYVLDGLALEEDKHIPQKVRGYAPSFARLFDLEVPGTYEAIDCKTKKESTNFGGNLLVGADGTLYNANANVLVAMRPKAPNTDLPLKVPELKNATTYLATGKITLEPASPNKPESISKGNSVILESGDSIVFRPGVVVQAGAQLSCKIQPTLKQ